MKQHSFFWKLFVGNLLLMGIILSVGGLLSYGHLNANYLRQSRDNQYRMVRISVLHFQRSWPQAAGDIDTECKQLFTDSSMRMTVIATDGRVLGDSQADPLTMENHKTDDRPEILDALRGESGNNIRSSETLGMEFRYFAKPVRKDGKVVGVVRVAMPVRAIAEGRAVIRNTLLWAAMAALSVAVIIAAMLSWIWHAPLKQITQAAREIAAGDLSAKANVRGSDELAQLAEALNEMRKSLATQIDTIISQREHLSAVVHNLREGVIALDKRGRMVLVNKSAAELLAIDEHEAVGQHLQAVVRIPDILDVYERAVETHDRLARQIEITTTCGQRTVDLHAANVTTTTTDSIAVLLVLSDITEITRAAAMRTQFVANASHELRTPLATLRAAVDSLVSAEDDDSESTRKILPILDRHVGRLEAMTKDLLNLHRIETARQRVNVDKIELASLVARASDYFTQVADDKKVELKINADQPSAVFESDRTLIQMILQNLIDNAIKFTPAGGKVDCFLKIEAHQLHLCVSDTGSGIPADMQERVFERFFQAEPSRSGDTKIRGTGLGLAIVKHATERLGGQLSLESTPNQGTTVTINLPKSPA